MSNHDGAKMIESRAACDFACAYCCLSALAAGESNDTCMSFMYLGSPTHRTPCQLDDAIIMSTRVLI